MQKGPEGFDVTRKIFGKGKHTKMTFHGPGVNEERIKLWKAVGVPPAYKTAWYANKPKESKTLAIAVDAKGKRHHYYHPEVTKTRNNSKFCDVAKKGPKGSISLLKTLKEATTSALHAASEVVIKCNMRPGSSGQVKENGTFGVTTMKQTHVKRKKDGSVELEFRGKHKVLNQCSLPKDSATARYVSKKKTLKQDEKIFPGLNATQLNSFLRNRANNMTAKQIRTWQAHVIFAQELKTACKTSEKSLNTDKARKAVVTKAVKGVSTYLHNTPSVVKKYYLAPQVIEAAQKDPTKNWTPESFSKIIKSTCN